jgi:hypothetical protein
MMVSLVMLCRYLRSLEPGEITDLAEPEGLLSGCWGEFSGGNAQGMTGDKLLGWMETVRWESPLLSFVIERHGDIVLGSSRASLQGWTLDIKARTATSFEARRRQLRPMARRVDVKKLAAEVFQLMLDHAMDERLRWHPDGTVRVEIGKILPANTVYKQTLQDRRKRFRHALEELVRNAGGATVRANVYRLPNARASEADALDRAS